jgi:hypothetical protein
MHMLIKEIYVTANEKADKGKIRAWTAVVLAAPIYCWANNAYNLLFVQVFTLQINCKFLIYSYKYTYSIL